MQTNKQYLIGGQRMIELGSDRTTNDIDYLVNVTGQDLFTTADGDDFINAAAHPFYGEIYKVAQAEGITAQLMMDMKAFSLVQHLQNFNFGKAASTEYDMKRLAIDHGIKTAPIAKKYMTAGAYGEIVNIISF